MKLHLWAGIRALRQFLAPLARNLTVMAFKLRSTLASDNDFGLCASVCLRYILIFAHKIKVRSKIANIHSAGAYDCR